MKTKTKKNMNGGSRTTPSRKPSSVSPISPSNNNNNSFVFVNTPVSNTPVSNSFENNNNNNNNFVIVTKKSELNTNIKELINNISKFFKTCNKYVDNKFIQNNNNTKTKKKKDEKRDEMYQVWYKCYIQYLTLLRDIKTNNKSYTIIKDFKTINSSKKKTIIDTKIVNIKNNIQETIDAPTISKKTQRTHKYGICYLISYVLDNIKKMLSYDFSKNDTYKNKLIELFILFEYILNNIKLTETFDRKERSDRFVLGSSPINTTLFE